MGTTPPVEFIVPKGRRLVITDVEWRVGAYGGGHDKNVPFLFSLNAHQSEGNKKTPTSPKRDDQPTPSWVVFQAAPTFFESANAIWPDAQAGGNHYLTQGFMLDSQQKLCPHLGISMANPYFFSTILLRGYLTD